MEIENRVFFRKFEGINLKQLTEEVIKKLLEEKVFIKCTPEDIKLNYVDEPVSESTKFEGFFVVNSEIYELNEQIINEIYFTLKYYVENVEGVNEWQTSEIIINLESIISTEEKIKYLEEKHKTLFQEVQKEPEFLVFAGLSEFNGFDSWQELITEIIKDDFELIQSYLTSSLLPFPDNIYNDWIKYNTIKTLCDLCKNKLSEIKNIGNFIEPKISIKNIDLSFQISLLEEIISKPNWSELSATQKGVILSKLLGKNPDNIKKIYLEFDKKNSAVSNKYLDDREKASEFIKTFRGN